MKCECGSEKFQWSGEVPCTGYLICMRCGKEHTDFNIRKDDMKKLIFPDVKVGNLNLSEIVGQKPECKHEYGTYKNGRNCLHCADCGIELDMIKRTPIQKENSDGKSNL